ncbi:MAG TPA: hypothetical protein VN029_05525 [Sphingomonas sp.]|nr:hypothetical protein [Sphingomonas sp.]
MGQAIGHVPPSASNGLQVPAGTHFAAIGSFGIETKDLEGMMGKGILLWLLGIPIPIILLILIFWH